MGSLWDPTTIMPSAVGLASLNWEIQFPHSNKSSQPHNFGGMLQWRWYGQASWGLKRPGCALCAVSTSDYFRRPFISHSTVHLDHPWFVIQGWLFWAGIFFSPRERPQYKRLPRRPVSKMFQTSFLSSKINNQGHMANIRICFTISQLDMWRT